MFPHKAYHCLMVIIVGGHVHPLSTDIAKIPDSVVIYGLVVASLKNCPTYLLLVMSFTLWNTTVLATRPYLSCYLVGYNALALVLPRWL